MVGDFNFRIMHAANGVDVIDETLITPLESLSDAKLMEYIETEKSLLYSKRQEKKQERQSFADCLKSALLRKWDRMSIIYTKLTQYICTLSKPEQDKLLEKAKRNIETLVEECEVKSELEMIRNSRLCDVADLIEA